MENIKYFVDEPKKEIILFVVGGSISLQISRIQIFIFYPFLNLFDLFLIKFATSLACFQYFVCVFEMDT